MSILDSIPLCERCGTSFFCGCSNPTYFGIGLHDTSFLFHGISNGDDFSEPDESDGRSELDVRTGAGVLRPPEDAEPVVTDDLDELFSRIDAQIEQLEKEAEGHDGQLGNGRG